MKKLITVGLILILLVLTDCSYLLPEVTTPPNVQISSNQLQTYFPRAGGKTEEALVALMEGTKVSLEVACYSLTAPKIVKALGDAKKRGVAVRVITDKVQSAGKSQTVAVDDLLLVGVPVKINLHSGLMHLKMTISDASVATTGSYNYTGSARDSNDEILVVISNAEVANRCLSEFNRMWNDPVGFTKAKMSY